MDNEYLDTDLIDDVGDQTNDYFHVPPKVVRLKSSRSKRAISSLFLADKQKKEKDLDMGMLSFPVPEDILLLDKSTALFKSKNIALNNRRVYVPDSFDISYS